MSTVTVEEARAKLADLIEALAPGDEVVITRDDQPVARLVPPESGGARPVFGSCRGMLTIVAEDDEHLEDFRDYLG